MIKGFNKVACNRRNRIMAARGKVEGAPIQFVADINASRGTVVTSKGELPRSDAESMSLINARLPKDAQPLSANQVWIHHIEAASNNLISDRHAFLATSTLSNIADGGGKGVAFMNSHRTGNISTPGEMPFGRTFAGRYEATMGEDGSVSERALLSFYMLQGIKPNGDSGPTTDDLHAMIESGTLFDVSVGLLGGPNGRAICDVCGQELRKCDHSPGTTRNMEPEQVEAQKGRGVASGKATYTMEDYILSEVSGVYDGAVPGAGFSKGLSIIDQLSSEEREQFREAFHALMDEESDAGDPEPPDATPRTISAAGGGTGQIGAGKTQAFGPGETKRMFKNALVRALSFAKLGRMATAVVSTDSEDPELLAQTMAKQVDDEVQDRIGNDPLMLACKAYGINTAQDLPNVMDSKRLGDKYLVDLRADACKEAIRAYGAELGPKISAQVGSLSASAIETMRDSWRAEADAKFGTTATKPAGRQTAAAGTTSVDDPAPDSGKKPWEKLSKRQQDLAIKQGHTTPEKQEAFALNFLANKEVQ